MNINTESSLIERRSLLFGFHVILLGIFISLCACDKVTIETTILPQPVPRKGIKPTTPVPEGCIRGFFGNYYKIFTGHIEKVQPVDSFSNCYFYGACNNSSNQINLIRCDEDFVLAIYVLGYPLDSLPVSRPVPAEFGRYTEIQYYQFKDWNSRSDGHYNLIDFYGKSVYITDVTDDVVTGTFEGVLCSPSGNLVAVTDGEFKIRIFRKYIPCIPMQ